MKKFKKIYVEITNYCNLNCNFCSKDNRKKKEMTIEEFESVLKKIDDYTDYLYLHVKGEPLLHSNLEEILSLCRKYNKFVNITTNGTLLAKNVDKLLNVRQINISFHSFKNADIKQILDASKFLADNGVYIVFRFWVYSDIQKELFTIISNYFNCDISLFNLRNTKIYNNIYINKDEEFIWPSLNNNILHKNGTCLGLKSHIGILSDGTVVPCCLDSGGVINLGNIFKDDLNDILNSKRVKNMLNGFKNNIFCEELCQKCGFKR